MEIIQIVAASTNNVIGKEYRLLWHLPNDMKWFKNKTWALPVVMGRKTFKSMHNKPMDGRLNIIITRQQDFKAEGVIVVNTIEAAIDYCKQQGIEKALVDAGGDLAMYFCVKIYSRTIFSVILLM